METKLKISNWKAVKAKLKKKYSKLTDADLTFTAGKEDELLTRLEKKLGKSKDELSDVIDEIQGSEGETEWETETGKSKKETTGKKAVKKSR